MSEVVRWSRDGAVAVVTVDNPPVNAISHAVRKGLYEAISAAGADPAVKAVVLLCAGRTFMAGADITEFGKPWSDPGLREVVLHLEDCARPVVAAIHGTALGGGFEIALGCHYRCAVGSARVGFPEVNLGLLPGAHGTQRLPRLIGIPAALDLIVSGKPIGAAQARALGALDEIVEGDLLTGALAYARRLIASGAGPRARARHVRLQASPSPRSTSPTTAAPSPTRRAATSRPSAACRRSKQPPRWLSSQACEASASCSKPVSLPANRARSATCSSASAPSRASPTCPPTRPYAKSSA